MQLPGVALMLWAAFMATPFVVRAASTQNQDFCVYLTPPPSFVIPNFGRQTTENPFIRRTRPYKSASGGQIDDSGKDNSTEDDDRPVSRNIIGGTALPQKAWPFLSALLVAGDTLRYNNQYWDLVCGATLIHPQFLLTAAHCFVDGDEYSWKFLDATNFAARVGDYDLVKQNVPTAVTPRIVAYKANENFSYDTVEAGYDVAIAKLEYPVMFNEWTQPACLPQRGSSIPGMNSPCLVAGWGAINKEGNRLSAYPRLTSLPASSSSSCYSTLEIPSGAHDGRLFCAGDPQGLKDSCAGDSGGPTFCQRENGAWELSGIVSFGGDSCADSNIPGAYTTISYFHDWIQNAIRELSAPVAPVSRLMLPPPPAPLYPTPSNEVVTTRQPWEPGLPGISRQRPSATAAPTGLTTTAKTDAALLDLLQVIFSSMSGRIAIQRSANTTTVRLPISALNSRELP